MSLIANSPLSRMTKSYNDLFRLLDLDNFRDNLLKLRKIRGLP